MAQNPEELRRSLDRYLDAGFRGRLRARGIARGIVWRDGVVPDGSPAFDPRLTSDLLDFGYVVLALALELRDANRAGKDRSYPTADAFEVAAEAIEAAVRRGNPEDGDQGRHLVIGATAFHLAGFAARSFSLLPPASLKKNLSTIEHALALLLRRDLLSLRNLIVAWLGDEANSDPLVSNRLADELDDFEPEDAVVVALTKIYLKALGLADTALYIGDGERFAAAIGALERLIDACAKIGNIPAWWAATLTRHLLGDLWDQSLHVRLPDDSDPDGVPPSRWTRLRRNFIAQLAVRTPPQIDLWPSQLEAARRSVNVQDHLVIALPTSAGKTRIAELCILRALADRKRVVYVTPLRALSAQVERILARTFIPLEAAVTSLYGAIGTSSIDSESLASAAIVVATPEKLDFALRQDPATLDDVGLVVFDEGHMIGLGSREIRYEVLIQRLLRRSDASDRRIVCLSAMFTPEDSSFKTFADWLRQDADGTPIHVDWRPTRRRFATIDWGLGRATLSFLEGEEAYVTRFVEQQAATRPRRKSFPNDDVEYCLATANAFVRDGHSVLIYSPQRNSIDPVVRQFTAVKRQGFLADIALQDRSDLAPALAIGREWLGSEHSVVKALEYGLGTHHGALPRPFQSAVEELLERKRLRVVVASPTLAQGVDLSCSVLLFRSLTRFDASTGKHQPIPAAEFANVVGRAGRAYVDLDGIVGVPCFDTDPAKRRSRHRQFNELIQASRDQSLVSGLVHMVVVLADRLSTKLGVDFNSFFNYVINNASLWSDARLGEAEDLGDDAEDDPNLRTLEEHLGNLDLAILSLVDPLDVPTEDLPALLDAVLQSSLWERTLCNLDPAFRQLADPLLKSRAVWLWKKTSVEQRRACFSAGLGMRAGLFIYSRLDELVAVLAQWQAAVLLGDLAEIGRIATLFAEQVAHDSQFFVRKPPGQWQQVLVDWILGKAFREMLTGLGVREEQRTQSFVQDGAVFRLVWAAEAVRSQALSTRHARAEELGDGPMMTLTHGVPSISAAVLCQAGFASRTGAWWAASQLRADFTTIEGMRAWMLIHKPTLEDVDFWENADQHLLWMRLSLPDPTQSPSRWHRRTSTAEPSWWSDVPINGTLVRLIPRGDQATLVCSEALEPIGELDLDFNPEGAAIEAEVEMLGDLRISYFGPN